MEIIDIKKVANYWGIKLPESVKNFYNFPPLRDYIFSCITGKVEKTDRDSLVKWTIEKYLGSKVPVDECLCLCCGFGEIERILAKNGVFRKCTGIDISKGAISFAREKAKQEGYDNIRYEIADINGTGLGTNKYDLIYANGALHHISNLEFVISNIYSALKSGGVLICNEYVGPKRQKLPFHQREIINSVIHLIPLKLRFTTEQTFIPSFFKLSPLRRIIYEAYRLLTLKEGDTIYNLGAKSSSPKYKAKILNLYKVIKNVVSSMKNKKNSSFYYGKIWDENSRRIKLDDPSECVRSDEIIPILKNTFKDIDIRYYNGSILFYALDEKFYNEYDPNRQEDQILLNLLINIERNLIEIGELSSDHAHIIAVK